MDETRYEAYLLRIWRAGNDRHPVWRFTLQPTGGGGLLSFDTPAELLAFLYDKGEGGSPRPPPDHSWER